MKVYIICSVRKRTFDEDKKIKAYVRDVEKQGHEVREPSRDTDQTDEIGLKIVEDHEQDIIWADEIHVLWNPTSEGSWWDVAQALMAKEFVPCKRIVWGSKEPNLNRFRTYTDDVKICNPIVIWWKPKYKPALWKMAQARMAKKYMPDKKIFLSNADKIKITPIKSYTNVALATHLGLTVATARTRQDLLDALSKK